MALKIERLMVVVCLLAGVGWARTQESGADAKEIVKAAVEAEIVADNTDHSRWRYKVTRKDQGDSVFIVVRDRSWIGEAADRPGWKAVE